MSIFQKFDIKIEAFPKNPQFRTMKNYYVQEYENVASFTARGAMKDARVMILEEVQRAGEDVDDYKTRVLSCVDILDEEDG